MPSATSAPTDLIRPYVWLAVTTFLIGFALTLATGLGHVAGSRVQAGRAILPTSADDAPARTLAKAI